MTTNSQLSTNEPKRKEKQQNQTLNKQPEQEQNQRNGHHMEGFQWGGRGRNSGEKVQGTSIINRHKIGRDKNSIGNVEAKELICMIHGHELREEGCGGVVQGREE